MITTTTTKTPNNPTQYPALQPGCYGDCRRYTLPPDSLGFASFAISPPPPSPPSCRAAVWPDQFDQMVSPVYPSTAYP